MAAQQAPDVGSHGLFMVMVYVQASGFRGFAAQGADPALALEHGVVLTDGEAHALAPPRGFPFTVGNCFHKQRSPIMKPRVRVAPSRRFVITREMAEHANPECSRSCAIASAMAADGGLYPRVDCRSMAYSVNGERFVWPTPISARPLIEANDERDQERRVKLLARISFPVYITCPAGTGVVRIARRTGGPDRTEKSRHAPGGRAKRGGFTGPRHVLTKKRMHGFEVAEVRESRRPGN